MQRYRQKGRVVLFDMNLDKMDKILQRSDIELVMP